MSWVTSSRLRWIAVAFVLPSLLFRALIPVGFMPMPGASGALELALCPGTIDGATFIAAAVDPHSRHKHSAGQRSPPCPYALSGTAMPLPAQAHHFSSEALQEKPRSDIAYSIFLPTIARTQQPRAPPFPA